MQALNPQFRRMLASLGSELFDNLADELESGEPTVAIRVNPCKGGNEVAVPGSGDWEPIEWCAQGKRLKERPLFTLDPAMHQGRYYVQDPSSMIISQVVSRLLPLTDSDGRPLRYLDACAAPGGKTTAAIAALPADAFVVANEYDYRRASILAENIIKWGSGNAVVSRGDTSRFRRLPGFFDIIAADVPCSGEGMMRKDEQARAQWSESLVEECAARQREILLNLWEALRPGGFLIYSTCTFNRTENEDILQFLTDELQAIPVPLKPMLEGVERVAAPWGMLRFIPGQIQGEGLAMGVVRKPEDAPLPAPAKTKGKQSKKGGKAPRGAASTPAWLPDSWTTIPLNDEEGTIRAIYAPHEPLYGAVAPQLDIIYAGIEFARQKGKSVVPAHPLAMALHSPLIGTHPEDESYPLPSVEVELPTALSYLRHESLGGFDAPKGPLLLTYGGYPLGFVNHLGNRSNNLYPAQWRILMR